jgi:hypothetical protein
MHSVINDETKYRTYRQFRLKGFPNFLDGHLITVRRNNQFHRKLLRQKTVFRQENIAEGTRSKFDRFAVVVLLDASFDETSTGSAEIVSIARRSLPRSC